MRRGREGGLILELRKELGLFARLCLLVFAVLFAHPYAMAKAAAVDAAFPICSQSDTTKGADRTHGLPGDCACCFACGIAAAPVVTVAGRTFEAPPTSGEATVRPTTAKLHRVMVAERPPARGPPRRA